MNKLFPSVVAMMVLDLSIAGSTGLAQFGPGTSEPQQQYIGIALRIHANPQELGVDPAVSARSRRRLIRTVFVETGTEVVTREDGIHTAGVNAEGAVRIHTIAQELRVPAVSARSRRLAPLTQAVVEFRRGKVTREDGIHTAGAPA